MASDDVAFNIRQARLPARPPARHFTQRILNPRLSSKQTASYDVARNIGQERARRAIDSHLN